MQEQGLAMMGGSSSGGGGIGGFNDMVVGGGDHRGLKAEIAAHPLYEQLLAAHIACLRVATPIDQLPLIRCAVVAVSPCVEVLRDRVSS